MWGGTTLCSAPIHIIPDELLMALAGAAQGTPDPPGGKPGVR